MAKEKKKKKGNYGKVLGFCVVVGCAAALLAWIMGDGGFGFGDGFGGIGGSGPGGNGNGSNGTVQEGQYDPPADTTATETSDDDDRTIQEIEFVAEPLVLIIRVVNNLIYHGDNEVTLDDLAILFNEVSHQDLMWELRDEQAIMETYENVIALMQEHGIAFTER